MSKSTVELAIGSDVDPTKVKWRSPGNVIVSGSNTSLSIVKGLSGAVKYQHTFEM